jgi:hypothetical protein
MALSASWAAKDRRDHSDSNFNGPRQPDAEENRRALLELAVSAVSIIAYLR